MYPLPIELQVQVKGTAFAARQADLQVVVQEYYLLDIAQKILQPVAKISPATGKSGNPKAAIIINLTLQT